MSRGLTKARQLKHCEGTPPTETSSKSEDTAWKEKANLCHLALELRIGTRKGESFLVQHNALCQPWKGIYSQGWTLKLQLNNHLSSKPQKGALHVTKWPLNFPCMIHPTLANKFKLITCHLYEPCSIINCCFICKFRQIPCSSWDSIISCARMKGWWLTKILTIRIWQHHTHWNWNRLGFEFQLWFNLHDLQFNFPDVQKHCLQYGRHRLIQIPV